MGRRGPPPTPTALLQLRGSWRGTYGNNDEPQPEKGRPRCPAWVDDYAKGAWRQIVPQLEAMGVLSKIDGHALTVLCQAWSRWRKATEFIQLHGETYPVKDEQGRVKYLKKFPQASIADSRVRTLNRFMQEFGLTPSARTRIEVKGREEAGNVKENFLNVDKVLRQVPGYDPFASAGECSFDTDAADHVVGFFEQCLVHVKGELAGQPFLLQLWQKAILGNLFGWKRSDGTRCYREAFVFVPRKNGKSLTAAGICTYALFCDGEAGAEIYSAAAERDQAALVFDVAKQMVRAEPVLAEACRIYRNAIAIESMGSSYKAISADASTKHGYNTHFAVIDELHAQRNRELVDVLITSTGARRQPLIVHITTSDFDRPSICNEKHEFATKVRDGIIEDATFLPVIYEAAREDDWTDPTTWAKANPNLGISLSEEYLAHECQRAQESPAYENTFKRLHLNIRTEQDVRWLSMVKWDGCGGSLEVEALRGRECWGGLDLGSTADLTSLCLLFPEEDDSYSALWWFWAPRDNAETRERRDRVPYLTWARQGHMELTDGDETDYRVIRNRVNEIGKEYAIRELAADRLFQGAELCQDLADDGFDVVPFGQGFMSMAAPTAEFERRVNRGELRHGDNPITRWMASNVSVRMDPAGNMKPDKQRSSERIDGIVASIMALGRAMVRDEGGSVYDTRGLIVV